ncbi:hypothetical protein GD1_102 [Paraglaciecola Antarctic GD virus 1]|nr:hypothetical protein GD1_102 [Paraglaciecola Antarctic GD virus 1]
MSWLHRVKSKSYYMYHFKDSEIIDYVATNDYHLIVAHLTTRYDKSLLPTVSTVNKNHLKIKMTSNEEVVKVTLTVNNQKIIIDSSHDLVQDGDRDCKILAQDDHFKSDEYLKQLELAHGFLVEEDLTPKQLIDLFYESFNIISGDEAKVIKGSN